MDVTNDQLQQVSALAEIQRKLEAEVKKKEESLKETKQQLIGHSPMLLLCCLMPSAYFCLLGVCGWESSL